jgi:hypothetical protein
MKQMGFPMDLGYHDNQKSVENQGGLSVGKEVSNIEIRAAQIFFNA